MPRTEPDAGWRARDGPPAAPPQPVRYDARVSLAPRPHRLPHRRRPALRRALELAAAHGRHHRQARRRARPGGAAAHLCSAGSRPWCARSSRGCGASWPSSRRWARRRSRARWSPASSSPTSAATTGSSSPTHRPSRSPSATARSSWTARWTARRARALLAWYQARATEYVEAAVARFVPLVGAAPARVVVRDLGKRRWGVCEHRTLTVTFHWQLVTQPRGPARLRGRARARAPARAQPRQGVLAARRRRAARLQGAPQAPAGRRRRHRLLTSRRRGAGAAGSTGPLSPSPNASACLQNAGRARHAQAAPTAASRTSSRRRTSTPPK